MKKTERSDLFILLSISFSLWSTPSSHICRVEEEPAVAFFSSIGGARFMAGSGTLLNSADGAAVGELLACSCLTNSLTLSEVSFRSFRYWFFCSSFIARFVWCVKIFVDGDLIVSKEIYGEQRNHMRNRNSPLESFVAALYIVRYPAGTPLGDEEKSPSLRPPRTKPTAVGPDTITRRCMWCLGDINIYISTNVWVFYVRPADLSARCRESAAAGCRAR